MVIPTCARRLGLCLLLLAFPATVLGRVYCQPGDSCWPTAAELAKLYNSLDPSLKRTLSWNSSSLGPKVSAVPFASPDKQPLYGLGVDGLKPLYVATKRDLRTNCFQAIPGGVYLSEFCQAATRSSPWEAWTPGIVAWPVNASQVVMLVKFAREHDMCISVAGTGHDYLNRHSCPYGMFIRTSLMKSKSFNPSPTAASPQGSFTFGPGIVFAEAHQLAAANNRIITSGNAQTVGIIGWSLGGGRGQFAPSLGYGSDSILSVDLVLANGTAITANATSHPDLYWALRGGGGSTWGIITSITVKAFAIPAGGFTLANGAIEGCNSDLQPVNVALEKQLKYVQQLSSKFGGYHHIGLSHDPANTTGGVYCPEGKWTLEIYMAYTGSPNDTEFKNFTSNLLINVTVLNYPNWYARMEKVVEDTRNLDDPMFAGEGIIPVDFSMGAYGKSSIGAGQQPSVIIDAEQAASGVLTQYIKTIIKRCAEENIGCDGQYFAFHDTFGRSVNDVKYDNTSISPAWRNAMFHFLAAWSPPDRVAELYKLGNHSYFSESAHNLADDDWMNRYWGPNAAGLLAVKKRYDPENYLGCHHCIGDDGTFGKSTANRLSKNADKLGNGKTSSSKPFILNLPVDLAEAYEGMYSSMAS